MRHRSAPSIHERLKSAVADLECAEQNVVTLFAEVMRTKRYRELGHGTILLYAMKELGFSQSKTYQFIRLAESLESLPKLKREVARGAVPWTKAREVAKVATKQTEGAWIGVAKRASRRELEVTVAETKAEATAARRSDRAQAVLPGRAEDAIPRVPALAPASIPTTVALRFTPEQFVRFEALVVAARKRGDTTSREALLLAALDAHVTRRAATATRKSGSRFAPGCKTDGTPIVARSPYQVTVSLCPRCRAASIPTSRGDAVLDAASTAAVLSDCERIAPDKRKRSAIPPRIRRTVFERDGHRCSTPGCRNTHFLEIDHILPVEEGGRNDPANLRLLCHPCHRARHRARPRPPAHGSGATVALARGRKPRLASGLLPSQPINEWTASRTEALIGGETCQNRRIHNELCRSGRRPPAAMAGGNPPSTRPT